MKKLINKIITKKIKGIKVKSNLRKDSGADEFIIKVILPCCIPKGVFIVILYIFINLITPLFL